MTQDELAYEMAAYLLVGKAIPEDLINQLMAGVCEDVKQEFQGSKPSDSKGPVA